MTFKDYDRLQVALPQDGYDIVIGAGLLKDAGDIMAAELGLSSAQGLYIVADAALGATILPQLVSSCERAGLTVMPPLLLPAGEETKSFPHYEAVITHLLTHHVKRDSVVVALGGGVIGDLAGFAAATVLRGIRLVQIPTTLLAQVDSSVGGKTGINTAQGKNLLGSFHHPALVLIDPASLQTLPAREMRAGYAEVLKYALLGDAPFFDWLAENGRAVLAGDAAALTIAIQRSCAAKAAIVVEDPYERRGRRALLNLGHTFGHALEALGGYDGRLLHGEAVAIGMHWAMAYSVQRGLCPAADLARVLAHMHELGLSTSSPFPVEATGVVAAMQGDKKNTAAGITLILCRGIGDAFVQSAIDAAAIETFLTTRLEKEA